MNEIMVMIEYGQDSLAVPMVQLACITRRASTVQAVGDWHY